jgi:threonine/homoserine/homoserine lactone efflux protein
MISNLLSVMVISFSGAVSPGPLLAIALTKSYRSPWAGTLMSLGHAVIEVPLVLLIYFGFAPFFQNTIVQVALSLAGGLVIIWMGVGMFRSRNDVVYQGKDVRYNSFVAGIVMSALNPFFFVWWATVGVMLILNFGREWGTLGLILFIIVHWSCDLIWLTAVSNTVFRTRKLWKPRGQVWVLIACAALMVGFGIWFIVSGVRTLLA